MGKTSLLMAVAAGSMAFGIASAQAADLEPVEPAAWYVSLFGGVSWLDDVDTSYHFYSDPNNQADIDTDVGFIVGGAIGAHVYEDLRVELEVAYSENDVDKIHYQDTAGVNTSYDGRGEIGILTFMANLWYDVPLSEDFKPYIGGGLGIGIVNADVGYQNDSNFGTIFDDSPVEFAFQLGAGIRYQVWENIALDIGYRFRAVDGPTFDSEVTVVPTSDYDVDGLIISNNIIAGVSYSF